VEKIIYANGTAEVLVPAGQKIAIATYGNEYATLSFKRGNNLEFIQRLNNAQVTLGPWTDVRTVNIEAAQDPVSYDVGTAPFLESNVRMSSNPFTGGVTGIQAPDGSRIALAPIAGSGWTRPFSGGPASATPFTFCNQHPVVPRFVGVQLGFLNLGTAAYTVAGAKVAVAPTDGNNGQALTWVDATFDNGVSSTATPKVIAAGSGATVNAVPGGLTATDVIPLLPVDRTDIPGNPFLVQTRSYISTNSTLHATQAGGITAFRAATGLEFGSMISPGDQVTNPATQSVVPSAAGTWICPSVVKFYYEAPTINVAGIGDSLMRGQGSTSGHNSGEEIACRQLSSASKVYAYANYGISGQQIAASFATAQAVLASDTFRPQVLVWKAFSPNDAYTQANFDAAYLYLLRLMDLCNQKGVALIVRNAQRWNQSPGNTALIEAFNARVAKLSGLAINDDYGILSAGAPDGIKNNLAYTVSAGDQHLSDAGYAAISATLKKLILAAYPA